MQVDAFGRPGAFERNVELEFERNGERYAFLRWGADGVRRTSAWCRPAPASATRSTSSTWRRWSGPRPKATASVAYPDTLVGTDSHTTMINGLGVLGWGVGGIEAEAAMLGQPISMLIPEVVGFKLTGRLPRGRHRDRPRADRDADAAQARAWSASSSSSAAPGLDHLPLADRATIANMAPEYGATCGFFPIDARRSTTCA